jgi:hypothetical protein
VARCEALRDLFALALSLIMIGREECLGMGMSWKEFAMATSYEVTCIMKRKLPHNSDYQITHIGGQTPQGKGWRLSMQEAMSGCMNGKWQFFMTVDGKRRDLQVGIDKEGSRCLQAKDEDTDQPALLKLTECKSHKDEILT